MVRLRIIPQPSLADVVMRRLPLYLTHRLGSTLAELLASVVQAMKLCKVLCLARNSVLRVWKVPGPCLDYRPLNVGHLNPCIPYKMWKLETHCLFKRNIATCISTLDGQP